MNIDAVLTMPDSNSIEMSREKNLTSENNIKLKCSFTVETYYPAFRRDRVIDEGYSRDYGSGMKDGNGFTLTGGVSNYFSDDSNLTSAVNNLGGGNIINTGGNTGVNTGGNTDGNTGGNTITNVGGSVNVNKVNTGTIKSSESVGVSNNTGGRPGSTTWVEGPFNPENPLTPYGQTGSFYNTESNANASDVFGTYAKDRAVVPKKTRWFNNILRARERASSISGNKDQQNITPRTPNQ
jgi:hypothetical protein